jgi:ATP-binding cassette subfamily F protein uup
VRGAREKARRLSYQEQREWDTIEERILAAEEAVAARRNDVEASSAAGHVKLQQACQALQDAEQAVEALYARWQELETKRGGEPAPP